MRLAIPYSDLENLIKGVFPRVPPMKAVLRITAVQDKVILQSGGSAAGLVTSVTRPGEVTLPAKTFRQIIATFAGEPVVELEAIESGLRINSFTMPVLSFNPAPELPDGFE